MTRSEPHPDQTPTRRRRPSLATVIALLALVVALGTGAEALPGRGSVQTDDLAKRAVTTPKIDRGAVTGSRIATGAVGAAKIRDAAVSPAKLKDHAMWALIDVDGSLIQGSGVASVTRTGSGIYFVVFNRGVVDRPLVATVYNEGAGAGQVNLRHCTTEHPAGLACEGGESPAKILVNTEDSTGANADRRFLVVAMSSTPEVITSSPKSVAPRAGAAEGR